MPPQSGPNSRADVVGSLKQAGIDTNSPTAFSFHLKFTSEDLAQKAKTALQSYASHVAVEKSRTGDWMCQARKTLVPDSGETESMLTFCKRTASDLRGTFEGWETDFGR